MSLRHFYLPLNLGFATDHQMVLTCHGNSIAECLEYITLQYVKLAPFAERKADPLNHKMSFISSSLSPIQAHDDLKDQKHIGVQFIGHQIEDEATLNSIEYKRYQRQMILSGFGTTKQLKLKKSKVLVIGAGGLGCPALQYLAGAGVGTIGIVDDDEISLTNLHRQTIYQQNQIGQLKVHVASDFISHLNHDIKVNKYPVRIHAENIKFIISNYDIVIDGSDNMFTRLLVNDTCRDLNIPLVYGSIFRFEGQVSFFSFPFEDGTFGPNYRDLFPNITENNTIQSCNEGGVIGTLPGIIGTMQAMETIKYLTQTGENLVGKIFIFDGLNFKSRIISFKP